MILKNCINNYFNKIPPDKWDYSTISHMKIIGYNKHEYIMRNYIRSLKEIIKENDDDSNNRKLIAEQLLQQIDNEESTMVINYFSRI